MDIKVSEIINQLLCREDSKLSTTLVMKNGLSFGAGMVFEYGEGYIKAIAVALLAFIVLYSGDKPEETTQESGANTESGSGSGTQSGTQSGTETTDDEKDSFVSTIDMNALLARVAFFVGGIVVAKKTGFGKDLITKINPSSRSRI